jgi:protein TonB
LATVAPLSRAVEADPISPRRIEESVAPALISASQRPGADPIPGAGAVSKIDEPGTGPQPPAEAPAVAVSAPDIAAPPSGIDREIPRTVASESPIAGVRSTISGPALDLVTPPVRITSVSPNYPQAARAALIEGDVLLEAVVTEDGKVTNVSIVRSVHPLLDEAARRAVRQYRYAPARRNGAPEAATVQVTVSFRMR